MSLAFGPVIIGFFLALLITEAILRRRDYVFHDSISNLTSGLTLVSIEVYFRLIFLVLYDTIQSEFALFQVPGGWIGFLAGLVLLDLAQYWNHRLSHRSNFFWSAHIGHHQSESFNLSVGARVNVPNRLTYVPLFMMVAVIGVPTESFFYANLIVGIFPFWYHTQMINRMGPIEWIFVTPSHHRVHHATQTQYLDRNYAAMFSFWDRLFGTFTDESEWPKFGILKPIPHHRIANGYFLQYRLLFAAVAETPGFIPRLKLLFGPPESFRISAEAWDRVVGSIEASATRVHSRKKILAVLALAIGCVFALILGKPLDDSGNFIPLTFVLCVASVSLLGLVSGWVEENVQLEKRAAAVSAAVTGQDPDLGGNSGEFMERAEGLPVSSPVVHHERSDGRRALVTANGLVRPSRVRDEKEALRSLSNE